MSRWRATMPKKKPDEDKADFVFAYRNNKVRFEVTGITEEEIANELMLHIIEKTKEAK